LGLQTIEENNNEKLDQTLKVLIELRNQARKSKISNFPIRSAMLLAEGIELKDGRDGTSYVLN
jgi:cysteinyl-tRNA synthetase